MSRLQPHLLSLSSSSSRQSRRVAFDIDDFTCASDQEKNVDHLEKHLRHLRDQPLRDQPHHDHVEDVIANEIVEETAKRDIWLRRRRIFSLYDTNLKLCRIAKAASSKERVSALERMSDFHLDFCSVYNDNDNEPEHLLHLYFGLDDFLLVEAYHSDTESIDNLTKVNAVLGTSSVALANCQCDLPLFVQVLNKSRGQYEGVLLTADHRVHFSSLALNHSPATNLDDLLRVFRERINVSKEIEGFYNTRITVRLNYVLRDWGRLAFTQDVADFEQVEAFKDTPGFLHQILSLPFGSIREPIDRLVLSCIWRHLDESTVMETATHTDLLPMTAPVWTCYVQMTKKPSTILRSYLDEMVSACSHRESIRQILGSAYNKSSYDDESQNDPSDYFGGKNNSRVAVSALTRLTGPSYSLSDIINSGRSTNYEGPIPSAVLGLFLDYLFPRSESSQFAYPSHLRATSSAEEHESLIEEEEHHSEDVFDFKLDLSAIKSCPENGLVWRLAILVSHCLSALGGVESAAYLFHKFVLQLRLLWETSSLIPGLPSGPLDHSYCLMHQKLQMINACINTKVARERGFEEPKLNEDSASSTESEEDEFFECDDDNDSKEEKKKEKEEDREENEDNNHNKEKSSESVPVWCQEPVGRLKRYRNLKLLKRPDTSLYVPICQELPNLPEDTIIEQEEAMLELGDSAEGSSVRTQMHTLSLWSDMESFKAANPGCLLEDFVRWYSPRDYIDSEKRLSVRMTSNEGKKNVWQETWQYANPVCARRQKRLFDDTREAEKTLAFLNNLSIGPVCELLTLPLLHAAFVRVLKEPLRSTGRAKVVRDALQNAVTCLVETSHLKCRAEVAHAVTETRRFSADFERRSKLIEETLLSIEKCEVLVSRALSLRTKFGEESLCIRESTRPEDKEGVEKLMETLVTELLESADDEEDDLKTVMKPVTVVGGSRGPAGRLIRKLFHDSLIDFDTDGKLDEDDVFVAPVDCKEYIIRANVPRPFEASKKCLQRMYACVKSDKFVLALATAQDRQGL